MQHSGLAALLFNKLLVNVSQKEKSSAASLDSIWGTWQKRPLAEVSFRNYICQSEHLNMYTLWLILMIVYIHIKLYVPTTYYIYSYINWKT